LSFELRVVFFFGLGYSSVVEYLPSMCEALYSIPATKKEKPRNKKKKVLGEWLKCCSACLASVRT
jgi:hypothetical protein